MKFLLKLFCLLSLLSSFSFSKEVSVLSKEATKSMKPSPSEIGFLNGREYLSIKSSKSDYAYLEHVYELKPYYILDRSLTPGFYIVESDDFFVDGVYNTGKFSPFQHIGYTVFSDFGSGDVHNYTLAYRVDHRSFLSCKYSENFGIKSRKCFPACPAGQSWDIETEKCISEQKRPDWCPKPMIYNERKVELLLRDKIVEECLPDPSISESDCKKRNMKFHGCDDSVSGYELATCMSIPSGCYAPETIDRFKAEKQLDNDLFIIGGFMIPLPISAIKNGFSSLGSFFKGLFSGGAKPTNLNLLEYRPQIVDVKATVSGPEPVFNINPVDDSAIVFNSVFKETGKLDATASASSNIVKSPQATADVSPNLRKFDLPKDASISKLENNTIVTAKLKDMSKPIPTKEITVPNEVKNINLDYDLNTMFKASDKPTPNLPMTIKQTSNAGNKSTYKGNIVTPDKSVIDVDVVETTNPSGSKVQDVTYSYIYKTPIGSSKFSTGYVNTIDSGNNVTNSIPKDSTSTSSSGGSSSNSSSGGSSSTTTPSQPTQSIDLSSLEQAINRNGAKLDTINDTLTSIKNQQLEQWNYEPNVNTATSFASLQSELTKFDVSVNDAFNFLNNFKGDIDNLMNNFNESLDIINKGIDAPDIPKGTCPFTISGPTPGSNTKNLFEIDPCRFVSPYKSILTLFFTIWFSFEIIMFSLKYLFRVGGES